MSDGKGSFERPPRAADEKQTLTAFLDFHRDALLRNVTGVSDEDARRSFVVSPTTLAGLVKHLAYVERGWFQHTFAGEQDLAFPWTEDDPDADFRIDPDETLEQIIEFYRQECAKSRAIVDPASLDDRAREARRSDFSLRWIMVHMIEETARHNGHADILRELIDGATGE